MKILFWMSGGFDAHTTSEHLLSAVIEQLAKAGNSVHVVQAHQGGELPILPKNLEALGVTTQSVTVKKPNKTNFVKRYLNAMHYCWKCRDALKNHRDSDAVFIQSTNVAGFAVWLARRFIKDAKITFNVQDIFPYNAVFSGVVKENGILFKTLAAVQRYGYKHSDHIITISDDMKDTLIADGTSSDKIEVIYNWSYQDELYEIVDASPADHMFDKNYFNVVYAGNIGVMQNVDILVEVAKTMKNDKNVWFHIIGSGLYKEKLETRANEYGIHNISFWPKQPPEWAPFIYSVADVNVIPLVKDVYRTALPSKTATCLACQKPIVFAIGKEGKFGQMVMKEAKCPVVDADKPEELVEEIQKIRKGQVVVRTKRLFESRFLKSVNSSKYAQIITENH